MPSGSPLVEALVAELTGQQLIYLGAFRNERLRTGPLSRGSLELFFELDAAAFPNLNSLRLRDNQLGDAGLLALLHCGLAENLVELTLGNNKVGDAGVEALLTAELPRLERLSLRPHKISKSKIGLDLTKITQTASSIKAAVTRAHETALVRFLQKAFLLASVPFFA